jgi:hypothetical protein
MENELEHETLKGDVTGGEWPEYLAFEAYGVGKYETERRFLVRYNL